MDENYLGYLNDSTSRLDMPSLKKLLRRDYWMVRFLRIAAVSHIPLWLCWGMGLVPGKLAMVSIFTFFLCLAWIAMVIRRLVDYLSEIDARKSSSPSDS